MGHLQPDGLLLGLLRWRMSLSQTASSVERTVYPGNYAQGHPGRPRGQHLACPCPSNDCPVTLLHRHRRHAAQFFGNMAFEDVPQVFHLFNEAQVCFGSLIPMFQNKAKARWLQICCEFMRAINSTRDWLNAVKEELRPLRLMVM